MWFGKFGGMLYYLFRIYTSLGAFDPPVRFPLTSVRSIPLKVKEKHE